MPSLTVSNYDERIEKLSPKSWKGDTRECGWYVVPMHKVALEHYDSKSTARHHKFELVGGAILHVVRTGDDDTDTRFETFYSNVKNAEEFATTKALDLSLVQARAFVKGFSDKAGLNCCACNSTSCLVATYNSMHRIEGGNA